MFKIGGKSLTKKIITKFHRFTDRDFTTRRDRCEITASMGFHAALLSMNRGDLASFGNGLKLTNVTKCVAKRLEKT